MKAAEVRNYSAGVRWLACILLLTDSQDTHLTRHTSHETYTPPPQAHQATAERQAADAEARLRDSERQLRDVNKQLSEQACRWRDSDRQRQSLDTVLHSAESVARQVGVGG